MPSARELTRMMKDVQELVPAVVAAILAIATALGVLIPGLQNGSSSIGQGGNAGTNNSGPANPSKSQGGFSIPETTRSNYLVDQEKRRSSGLKSNVAVTVDGKDHAKSLISTADKSYYSSHQEFIVPAGYQSLNFTAAWADNIPNSGGVGVITVKLDGGERGTVYVNQGESKPQKIDVRGGGRVSIDFEAVNNLNEKTGVAANGLAALSPVLK